MGRQQLQLALGQHGTGDLRVFGIMQAQAQVGLLQQQAPDDVAGRLAGQVAGGVLETPTQQRNALRQQLIGQRRCTERAQWRRMMMLEAAGQALYRFQGFVEMGDLCLHRQGFPGGLQPPADAGKQHESQLLLSVLEGGVHVGHSQLQPFGGGAEVSGLQNGLNHFDMT
ncbi:hypothetical protein A2T76_05610 [Pseudomonas brenneri]|nr:hypothetical protein A2T76_05610 [Pseudomonas brenneri]